MNIKRLLPAVLGAAALILVACGGDDDAPSTPTSQTGSPTSAPTSPAGEPTNDPATPTQPAGETPQPSTPTPQPLACPDDDPAVCDFAATFDQLMREGRYAEAVALFRSRDVTCTGEPVGQGYDPDARLCEGKPAGTVVKAYDAGRTYSEGMALDADGMAALLMVYVNGAHTASHDAFGGGALRMYTIGYFDGFGPDGRMLVYSRVVNGEGRRLREAVFFHIEKIDGEWGIRSTINGLQIGDEIVVKLAGGETKGARYTVWNPVDGTKEVTTKGLWYGASVFVTDTMGECLNVRTAPATGDVLACLADGEQLTVVGDSVAVDGTLFWDVAGPGNLRGYASGDYLSVMHYAA